MYSSLLSDDLIPVEVHVDDAMIRVRFNGGLETATPVSRFPRLAHASPEARESWRLIGRGDGIHWPELDEDISIRTPASTPQVDAYTSEGQSVQIKLTGEKSSSYGFRWSSKLTTPPAELLIALQLTARGFIEIYDGAFPISMLEGRQDTSDGQLSIARSKLMAANPWQLPHVQSFDDLNRWFTHGLSAVA